MKKIKEFIQSLITDKTSVEDAEQIGRILNEVDKHEQEHTQLITSHEELRQKYVKAIQQQSFKGEMTEENKEGHARTLEEIAKAISKGEK